MRRSQARTTSTSRSALVGALVTAGLAVTGAGPAAPANATCASFSGITLGSGCSSALFGLAIGLGAGATAGAGPLSSAFSIGKDATASSTGALSLSIAAGQNSLAQVLGGFLNAAVAVGNTDGADFAQADAGDKKGGFANIAVTLSKDSYAYAGGFYAYPGVSTEDQLGAGNIAVNLGTGNDVEAFGFLNGALGVGGEKPYVNNFVAASGVLNSASSVGGNLNTVGAGGTPSSFANSAFNVLGSNNTVTAGTGPLTLAGSLFTSDSTVTRTRPGVNINGVSVPRAARSVPAPAAGVRGKRTVAATATVESSTSPAPAAAAAAPNRKRPAAASARAGRD